MEIYYHEQLNETSTLPEKEAHHCIHVMRHKVGEVIYITDGVGGLYEAQIESAEKKRVNIRVIQKIKQQHRQRHIHIAVAPVKNMDRMEFMVEKLTELGVAEISLLHTRRCERDKINPDKLNAHAIAAVKQSRNFFKPIIHPMIGLRDFLKKENDTSRWVAALDERFIDQELSCCDISPTSHTILIGPEGDFTLEELDEIIAHQYQPVRLGKHILRTETATIYAAVVLGFNK